MQFVRCLSFLLLVGCLLPACAAEPSAVQAQSSRSGSPETEEEMTLYALGQLLGQNVTAASLTEEELGMVFVGLSDIALGRDAQVDMEQYATTAQMFMQARIQASAEAELAEANAFVDEQAAVEGAIRTDTGIVIQEITPGTGAVPSATDTVRVHYHGTLRTGEVFDSSVDRGEPAEFPLNGVIACWTEALQTMQVGGKSRLVCPPHLAYGPSGPPGIPGNAALMFEVELLEIVEN